MSQEGVTFLHDWLAKNIDTGMFSLDEEALEVRVNIAIQQCVLDAERAGISREDIEEDMGELSVLITEAMKGDNS
ncbi:DUF768 domain-containing protein [Allomesorhizobium camelthorni]|uniref:DUF768 domain-containing protein n=1 Tax=Allomesorhizobium camelthorni TaxID=475069 RepID=A0A6G4WLK7_9HYPH|nr:DUF768 domain-containing protein [Mesorhizobium camelthorni]NGO55702.1 DUF768 domain-containing protein [Mesorhizobium camelthorni]